MVFMTFSDFRILMRYTECLVPRVNYKPYKTGRILKTKSVDIIIVKDYSKINSTSRVWIDNKFE